MDTGRVWRGLRQVNVLRRGIDYHEASEASATAVRVIQAAMPAMYSSVNECTKHAGHAVEP
jgi:hypothetical protein